MKTVKNHIYVMNHVNKLYSTGSTNSAMVYTDLQLVLHGFSSHFNAISVGLSLDLTSSSFNYTHCSLLIRYTGTVTVIWLGNCPGVCGGLCIRLYIVCDFVLLIH